MKKLCLVRHAKASQDMQELSDIDRPLVERGYKEAHAMSKKLNSKGFRPQLILTSTGIRALTTALIFARNLNYNSQKVVLSDKLYNAPATSILNAIYEIPDDSDQIMIFGHNPSITDAANILVNNFIDHVPTCGIACIEFRVHSWTDVPNGSGKLLFLDYPGNK